MEEATYIPSNRGGKLLLIDNHTFRINKRYEANNVVTYCCSNASCSARATVKDNRVGKIKGVHNHEGNRRHIEAKMFKAKLKQRILKERSTSVVKIYKEELAAAAAQMEDVSHLPQFHSCEGFMYRIRSQVKGKRTRVSNPQIKEFIVHQGKDEHPLACQDDSTDNEDDLLSSKSNQKAVKVQEPRIYFKKDSTPTLSIDQIFFSAAQPLNTAEVGTSVQNNKEQTSQPQEVQEPGEEQPFSSVLIQDVIKVEPTDDSDVQVVATINYIEPELNFSDKNSAPSLTNSEQNPPIKSHEGNFVEPNQSEKQQVYKNSQTHFDRKDEITVFGEHVAAELRTFDEFTRAVVQHKIENMLFEAKMSKFKLSADSNSSLTNNASHTDVPTNRAYFL